MSKTYPRGIGVYPLHDGLQSFIDRVGGKKVPATFLDNADEAVKWARLGHDCWLRKYLPDDDLSVQYIADQFPYVPDDVKALIGAITNNEQDWGWARRAGESARAWIFRGRDKTVALAKLLYAKGFRRFTMMNFSMGTFDVTDEETRLAIGDAYRDLYDNQTLDGTVGGLPVEWWVDMHGYVPDETWLYDTRTVPATLLAESATLFTASASASPAYLQWGDPRAHVVCETITLRDGRQMEVARMEIDRNSPSASALPATGRVIHPYDWYTTRWHFLFWPEMGIRFNHLVHRIKASETLVDKMGTGGAPAQGMSAKAVHRTVLRMNEILYEPLDIDGQLVESPFGNTTIFTSSVSEWLGYSINYVLRDSGIAVAQWVLG